MELCYPFFVCHVVPDSNGPRNGPKTVLDFRTVQDVSSLDRFTGKLIQSSIRKFWGVTQTVLLENSSIKNHGHLCSFFKFWGVTQTVLLENSSRQKFEWMSFPVKRPVWRPRIEISKKKWMSFPVKRSVWRPGKWKFQKNFWMSFPWFANKG